MPFTVDTSRVEEYIASVDRNGQMTLPAPVRRHLKLHGHRKVALLIGANGDVYLRAPKYATLESIAGAVKALGEPMTMDEMRVVIADELAEHHRAKAQ